MVTTKKTLKAYWPSFWNATKEPLRMLVLAIISWGIAELMKVENPTMTIAILTLALRWFDKIVHEIGKERDSELLVKGITRF